MAAHALRRAGYSILERNVRLGRYEIDIIAREGDTIAFVEVKTRSEDELADPEDSVTLVKRRHLSRAARMYLARADDPETYLRFDVVSVVAAQGEKPRISIHRNAFQGD